jgi:hypothetical protein
MGMNDDISASTEGHKSSLPRTRKLPWYKWLFVLWPACIMLGFFFIADHNWTCPRPHLYIGPKLAWRSYFWYGLKRWNYWAATGQLDQDADQELLVCLEKTRQTDFMRMSMVVFNADGKRISWGTSKLEYGDGLGLWDYNADGRDDILSSHYDYCSVIDLDGTKLAKLKGGLMDSANAVGCLGRGQTPQLVLNDWPANGENFRCYSQNSTVGKTYNPHQEFDKYEVLDLDHDGVSEIWGKLYGQGEIETWLSLRNGEVRRRYNLPKPKNFGGFRQVSTAGDMGYFYKTHSYVNMSTGKKMHLICPPKQWKEKWDWGALIYYVASGDFLGNGELQFAIAASDFRSHSILLFNTAGECIYYQDMGCAISWITRLHANNRDYLVAFAEERIFVYP